MDSKEKEDKERLHLDQLATRNEKDSQIEERSPVVFSKTRLPFLPYSQFESIRQKTQGFRDILRGGNDLQ